MHTERYWVVGGEYSCLDFKTLKSDPQVFGPFDTHAEARAAWRQVSDTTKASATAKFAITSEHLDMPDAPA